MDLPLYLRVLWRHRRVVVVGLILALALALLSHVRISLDSGVPSFSYRQQEVWQSEARLFVTQPGAPWARSGLDEDTAFAQERLTSLAVLYANLAISDQVMNRLLRDGPVNGSVTSSVVTQDREAQPFIRIFGGATSADVAVNLTRRAARNFISYLDEEQTRHGVRDKNRVRLVTVGEPSDADLVIARSLTRPTIIFLTVLMAVLGLVLIMDNLRSRAQPVGLERLDSLRDNTVEPLERPVERPVDRKQEEPQAEVKSRRWA